MQSGEQDRAIQNCFAEIHPLDLLIEPAGSQAPAIPVSTADRVPCVSHGSASHLTSAALLSASVLAHAAFYPAFVTTPQPLASIGEVSISVEIVLGLEHAAGLSPAPLPDEAADSAASNSSRAAKAAENQTVQVEAPPFTQHEQEPDETKIVRAKVEPVSPPFEEKPIEPEENIQAKFEEPKVIEQQAAAATKQAEPQLAPTPEPAEVASRPAVASAPSIASSGIGRGRSDTESNYRGLVAAHLAHHKRFPEDARIRREQGSAVVTFALDGSGKVTAVDLTRSSGKARIDEAAQAMIRRASPFPSPPAKQPVIFTVPVTFQIR
jgi:protein TonB